MELVMINDKAAAISTSFGPKAIKDIHVLAKFVKIYCRENHPTAKKLNFEYKGKQADALKLPSFELCESCAKLLTHGIVKRAMCPMDPKPMCKKCPNHCYHPIYRDTMREVMKFSGVYMAKRGRLDVLLHYLA
jgi:hypothetical protein